MDRLNEITNRLPSWEQVREISRTQLKKVGVDPDSPAALAILYAVAGSASTLGLIRFRKRYWTRIPNSDMVPGQSIARKRWVKGVVTR